MKERLLSIISRNVRVIRKSKGLSQEELAEIAQLHRTYIGSVEREERNLTIRSLERIASALNVDPIDLMKGGE